jgi:cobalt-zinc-cadmium resistance protein CzcA
MIQHSALQGDPLNGLASTRVSLSAGRTAPLSTLFQVERAEGPVSVRRELGQRFVVVVANVRDRDLVSYVEEARARITQAVDLPTGFTLAWGGEFENQQRAARRLMLVVPVALLMIFLLLFSTFRSLMQATLVMANVPLALIGGVFSLAITGQYLSVPASVGFIALMGIAVLNGVVLLSHFNQLSSRGLTALEVVSQGSQRRLRPVLMTASIAALGLVPLLFVTGPGAEIQRPLAIVVIGGLLTSTALTLFVLPVLYQRFAGGEDS